MKILHVLAGLGRSGAGVREMVLNLARSQIALGADVGVIGIDHSNWLETSGDWEGIPVKAVPLIGPKQLGYAPSMTSEISSYSPNIVHLHGLWRHHGRSVLQWSHKTGKPYLLSPHGMLAPAALAYSGMRKQVLLKWFQSEVLANAAGLHATSLHEARDIQDYHLKNPIIRFGIGVEDTTSKSEDMIEQGTKAIVYLGRIHPIKGLDRLIQAWSNIEADYPDWELVIAGPDTDREGQRLAEEVRRLGLIRVDFRGPVWDDAKNSLLRSSDIFVLPSHSENFAITIAESLIVGVPVVTTTNTPWEDVNKYDCGRCVKNEVKSIASALRELMKLSPTERFEMGQRGRRWMLDEFTWPNIAKQSLKSYREILEDRDLMQLG